MYFLDWIMFGIQNHIHQSFLPNYFPKSVPRETDDQMIESVWIKKNLTQVSLLYLSEAKRALRLQTLEHLSGDSSLVEVIFSFVSIYPDPVRLLFRPLLHTSHFPFYFYRQTRSRFLLLDTHPPHSGYIHSQKH